MRNIDCNIHRLTLAVFIGDVPSAAPFWVDWNHIESAFIYVGVALDTTSLLTGEDALVCVESS